MDFADTHLPHVQMILAENVFATLKKEGMSGNLLDVEDQLSQFSDNILIVLESESTFTELGAFSNKKLRKKLIVINDSKFRHSRSFINLGPLKAIQECGREQSILYYKMSNNGLIHLDSIGDIYAQLHALLEKRILNRPLPTTIDECDPGLNFDKRSVMLVHDLLYLVGPLFHHEIVEILKLIFGKKNFQLQEHMALLVAINSIIRSDQGLYRSKLRRPYYRYLFDINRLISLSRNYMLKAAPERIYGH